VFPEKLTIKRDCSPNTRWGITHDGDLKKTYITFRTTKEVAEDEFLTAAWGNEIELGTLFRQDAFTTRFVEPCTCSRCRDPSELGTEFSTLGCPDCKRISHRSLDPTNLKSDWGCSSKECKNRVTAASQVLKRFKVVYDKLKRLLKNKAERSYPAQLLTFIATYSAQGKILHPNHFLITLAANYLIRYVTDKVRDTQTCENMDFTLLTSCENFVAGLLQIYPTLIPGNTEIRGRKNQMLT